MRIAFVALVAVSLFGCAGTAARPAPAPQGALYRALGGTAGITRVVDLFLTRINADARINTLFTHADHADLRRLVIEQLCAATGGPCVYGGRNMEEAHSGLNLTEADFSAFMGDLVAAMDDGGVPLAQQNQVIALLVPMKPQIVGQ
ncbi:MAG: group 1 truncated hemoglobin [Proteobacteria bacterium]|nr:group 1 truncated hemoglobin [Pseudomonadota bacterium]